MSEPEDVVRVALMHMTFDQMNEWFLSPNPAFNGGRPIDFLESEVGRGIMIDALQDLADGISSP